MEKQIREETEKIWNNILVSEQEIELGEYVNGWFYSGWDPEYEKESQNNRF